MYYMWYVRTTYGRTLEMYGIEGSHNIMKTAASLPDKWNKLYSRAKDLEFRLRGVKGRQTADLENHLQSHLERVDRVLHSFRHGGYYGRDQLPLEECFSSLQFYIDKVERITRVGVGINRQQQLLKRPITVFHVLRALQGDIASNREVLHIFQDFQGMVGGLREVSADSFGLSSYEESMLALQARVDGMDISAAGQTIVAKLRLRVSTTLLILLELDKLLRGELSRHHWERFVTEYLGRPDLLGAGKEDGGGGGGGGGDAPLLLTVGDFLSFKLEITREAVNQILQDVSRERKIELELQSISSKWEDAKLTLEKWTSTSEGEEAQVESGGGGSERGKISLLVITNTRERLRELARDCQSLNKILSSKSAAAFHHSRIQQEKGRLQGMQSCLWLWERVQTSCLTLVRVQFGKDERLVGLEDDLKKYMRMMNEAMKKPSVKACCSSQSMARDLERFSDVFHGHLLSCRVLVEASRRRLPRLKLLSFKEVLVVLGGWERDNEPGTEKHFAGTVVKLFGTGISFLRSRGRIIVGVETSRGEVLHLTNPVAYRDKGGGAAIEDFLSELLDETRLSLKDQAHHFLLKLDRARSLASTTLEDIVQSDKRILLEQLCHLVHEVAWNEGVESSLALAEPSDGFKAMLIFLIRFAKKLSETFFATSTSTSSSSSSSSSSEHFRLRRLVNLYMGKRDLLYEFLRQDLARPGDFLWRSLLRTCWDPSARCLRLCQGLASLEYSYELHPVPEVTQETTEFRRSSLAMMMGLWRSRPILLTGEAHSGKKTSLHCLVRGVGIVYYQPNLNTHSTAFH